MIDYDTLKHWRFDPIEHRYTEDDTILYGLAIGLGENPTDPSQLAFIDDARPGAPLAFPTMAVVLGFPGSWMADPRTGIQFDRIVHGEEMLEMHAPLPSSGTIIAHHHVARIIDKGVGRGALIEYVKTLRDKSSGRLLATVTHTTFARGDGGFSSHDGKADAAGPALPPVPRGMPDHVVDIRTLPQQALLYRLCGDRNPLHTDPDTARAAGFPRPILHGLCSFGLALRAAGMALGPSVPQRLACLRARFSAPVYPGETLAFEFHAQPWGMEFRALVRERAAVVLDHGQLHLYPDTAADA